MKTISLMLLSFSILACSKDDATDDTGSDVVDADGDGFDSTEDCDDDNADVNPDALELCDEIDNNCDGTIDEETAEDAGIWYADTDGDTFGDPDSSLNACEAPEGYVDNDSDCADDDADINPDAAEICDSLDNDCDTEVDEEATDMSTWYTDGDGDGFGDDASSTDACDQPSGTAAAGGDCDDANANINPGAAEICDGLDNDCDSSTTEEGMATWTDSTGTAVDITADLTGTATSPAAFTIPEGDVNFCDGTFYVNLVVEGSSKITSQSADPTTTILDGGATDSVVNISGEGLSVSLTDLTIQNGVAAPDALFGVGLGGGIKCAYTADGATFGSSQVNIDNTMILANTADYGAGIFGISCDFTVANTEISYNIGGIGGGLVAWDSDNSVTSTTIDSNEADALAGGVIQAYFLTDEVSADFDGVVVSNNVATDMYGGFALASGTFTWTGTTGGGDSGFWNNSADTDGGGLTLADAEFTADVVDFGTSADGTDNSPYDVFLIGDTGDHDYWAGDDSSFTCDSDGCGSPTSTITGDTSSQAEITYILGNVLSVSDTGTLESVDSYTSAQAGCSANVYLVSSSDASGMSWDVEWASTGLSTNSSDDWLNSGTIGKILDSSLYYALVWDHGSCDSSFTWREDGTDDTITGLGETSGMVFNISESTTYSVGDAIELMAYPSVVFYQQYNVTEL